MFRGMQYLALELALHSNVSNERTNESKLNGTHHPRIRRRIRNPTSKACTKNNMIYDELPLGPIAPRNLDMPFARLEVLKNGGDGGRGPDIKFECVRIELEPIGELQSGCIDRPGLRESKGP